MREEPSRRDLLAAAVAGVAGVSGCSGESSPPTDTVTTTPEPRTRFQSPDLCSPPAAGAEATCRQRLRCRGRPIEQFGDASGWRPWGGTATLVEDGTVSGNSAVRVSAVPEEERCGVVVEFDEGIDLSAYDLSVGIRFENPPTDAVAVEALAPGPADSVRSVRPGYEAGWIRLAHGHDTIRGDPDLTDVRALRIGTYVGQGETATLFLDGVRGTRRRDRGLVAFTFDDNDRTQYERAFPIMRQYGFPGAVGVIPHTTEWSGKVGVDGLREMQSAGWEVVSHPQRPATLRELPADEARSAIANTKQWLVDRGFETGARFFVWPYGAYDRASLAAVARHHDLGFTTSPGVVGRITDPLVIPRVDAEDVSYARRAIEIAERDRQLCVVMVHEIGEAGIAEADFRDLVRRVDDAAVDVVTLSEIRDRLPAGQLTPSRPDR